MIRFIVVCMIVLANACGGSSTTDKKEVAKADKTTPEQVKAHMEYLSSDELAGREAGTPGIEAAASYIENFFEKNGVGPYLLVLPGYTE